MKIVHNMNQIKLLLILVMITSCSPTNFRSTKQLSKRVPHSEKVDESDLEKFLVTSKIPVASVKSYSSTSECLISDDKKIVARVDLDKNYKWELYKERLKELYGVFNDQKNGSIVVFKESNESNEDWAFAIESKEISNNDYHQILVELSNKGGVVRLLTTFETTNRSEAVRLVNSFLERTSKVDLKIR